MTRQTRLILLALTLIAFALRVRGLFSTVWQADEALYATWARHIAVWRDPLLQNVGVEKPPLLFYLQAIFFPLMGAGKWVVRLPSLVASVVAVPILGRVTSKIYRHSPTTYFATAALALSPLAIPFGHSAYIEPLLMTLILLALPTPGQKRPVFAGVWFGLALAAKFQAVMLLPFIIGLAAINGWRRHEWVAWLRGLLPVLALLGAWLWQSGMLAALSGVGYAKTIAGLRPIASWEMMPRFFGWLAHFRQAFGSPWLLTILVIGLPALVFLHRKRQSRADQVDRWLLFTLAALFLGYWLIAFPMWGRLLVVWLPILVIGLGRVLSLLTTRLKTPLPLLILAVLMLPAALRPPPANHIRSAYPPASLGQAEVAAYLTDAPYGTVLYDHWYSWHWRYDFFDTGVYVSWFPHADGLLRDLGAFAGTGGRRYLVVPNTVSAEPILRAVRGAGYTLDSHLTTAGTPALILYEIR